MTKRKVIRRRAWAYVSGVDGSVVASNGFTRTGGVFPCVIEYREPKKRKAKR
jgi:hypothetical protein